MLKLLTILFLFYKYTASDDIQTVSINNLLTPKPTIDLSCSSAFNGSCCSDDEFQCNDGSCIPIVKACDSPGFSIEQNLTQITDQNLLLKLDCQDGSDEYGCSNDPCSSRLPSCAQKCFDLPANKSFCSCKDGYALPAATLRTYTCLESNACSFQTHNCSHNCHNVNGSYLCSCEVGFHLDNNGHCNAEDRNIFLLYHSDVGIYSYDLKEDSITKLLSSGRLDSMDYDPSTGSLYWWNQHRQTLKKTNIRSPNVTEGHRIENVCISNDDNSIDRKNIVVDRSVKNMYWISNMKFSDGVESNIMVSEIGGFAIKTVIHSSRGVITSFILDSHPGSIFWTSAGHHAHIGQSHLDGSGMKTFVSLEGQHPEALTLDRPARRFYWFDTKSMTIFARHKTGHRNIRITTLSSDLIPKSMDAFENHLFWVSKDSGVLAKHDKFGGGATEILIESLKKPTALIVYHSSKSRDESSIINIDLRKKCQRCSDICIPLHSGVKCFLDEQIEVCSGNDCHLLRHHCSEMDESRDGPPPPRLHSHITRNLLIATACLLIALIFIVPFCIFFKQRSKKTISKFIQLEEVSN